MPDGTLTARPPRPDTAAPGPRPRPAPPHPAREHLAAIADKLTACGITPRLTHLGGTLVLTIDHPAGPDYATITIDPDPGTVNGLPLDCTCLWTPGPGTAPDAIAGTIAAIFHAISTGASGPTPAQDTPRTQ
jgi:hypothetical protein